MLSGEELREFNELSGRSKQNRFYFILGRKLLSERGAFPYLLSGNGGGAFSTTVGAVGRLEGSRGTAFAIKVATEIEREKMDVSAAAVFIRRKRSDQGEDEARLRELVSTFNRHFKIALAAAAELHRGHAFRGLGYKHFYAMQRNELVMTRDTLENQVIAEDARSSTPSLSGMKPSLYHGFAKLHKLPPEKFAEGWMTYAQSVGDGNNPVRVAREVFVRMMPPKRKKGSKKDIDKLFGDGVDVRKSAEYLKLQRDHHALIQYYADKAASADPKSAMTGADLISIVQRMPIAGIPHEADTYAKKGYDEDAGIYEDADGAATDFDYPED